MRIVAHLDMDAFFASVEERSNPALRGLPIAVIGSAERTVVTTASYAAREYGVRTGMNKYEARRLCPELVFVVGNNRKYTDTSSRIVKILKDFSPAVEVYSIDEAFLDLSGSYAAARAAAREIKARIKDELALPSTIGIAPNKLLAKLASDRGKPDGLAVIEEGREAGALEDLPVGELWGIGPKLTAHLSCMGITTCGELARFPAGLLRRRFGIIGERLSQMARGVDPSPVVPLGSEKEAKSVGHSMTLPKDVWRKSEIERHILKLSEMVGSRARRHGLKGTRVALTIRYPDFHTFGRVRSVGKATNDTRTIYEAARTVLSTLRLKSAVRLLGVSLAALVKDPGQMHLFEEDRKRDRLLDALDKVNGRFGDFTLTWASLLDEKEHSGVISPAWRPAGVRKVDVK